MATVANVRVAFLGLASAAVLAFAPSEERLEFLQETHEVTIREGTNMAAVLSPDGSTLALDALGRIWVLPAEGGSARPLTDPLGDARKVTHQSQRFVHHRCVNRLMCKQGQLDRVKPRRASIGPGGVRPSSTSGYLHGHVATSHGRHSGQLPFANALGSMQQPSPLRIRGIAWWFKKGCPRQTQRQFITKFQSGILMACVS